MDKWGADFQPDPMLLVLRGESLINLLKQVSVVRRC